MAENGGRVSELCQLRGKHVNRQTGHVLLAKTKTHRQREVGVTPEVMSLIPVVGPEEYVFPSARDRNKPLNPRTALGALHKILERVGLADQPLDTHSFRRYVCRKLHSAGVPLKDAMEIVGTLEFDEGVWGMLRATRFSGERAYALTYWYNNYYDRHFDLYTIDVSLPSDPAVSGILEVDGDVSHFEVRGNNTRLLALGRSWDYQDYRTMLTLYDVENAAAATMLSQVRLGDGSSSSSTANYDYKALKSFVADRPGHDRRYAIDATKSREELGWRPAHDLEAGMAATIRWYLEHRDWCESVQTGTYSTQISRIRSQ